MSRRVNATDQRIRIFGPWNVSTYYNTLTCTSWFCQIFLLFRGTGIRIYGSTPEGALGTLQFELDGFTRVIELNSTTFSNEVTPVYYANMTDGDHQLLGRVTMLSGLFTMDYLVIENLSGDGFDLLSAGPTAQDVPPQAVTVDNTNPAIYRNKSQWLDYPNTTDDYGGTLSCTAGSGSLKYSFDGVAIWVYGQMCPICGSFNVSIDGSTPQRFNASNSVVLYQRMIWSNTGLDPGRHTLNITYDDVVGTGLFIDFFRVLPGPGTSTLLSSFSSTNLGELPATVPATVPTTLPATVPTTVPPVPLTNQNQINKVPLVVGLTLGLLVLVVVVLFGVRHIYGRRGRRPIEAHSVSPYTGTPIRRADQQPSMPPVLKGVPQPAHPSGAPMATVDSAMSSGLTGLGPPPSYEVRE